jgi:hypothetical protein
VGDSINHPSHYTQGDVECIEIIGEMDQMRATCIKYLWRYKDKVNPIEDLRKAEWYLARYINTVKFKRVPRKIRKDFEKRHVYTVLCHIHGDRIVAGFIEDIIQAKSKHELEMVRHYLQQVIAGATV